MTASSIDLDALAMRLAARQGQSWHEMGDFPGDGRNIWRDTARTELLRLVPEARVETLPERWDGRDGGCVIHLR